MSEKKIRRNGKFITLSFLFGSSFWWEGGADVTFGSGCSAARMNSPVNNLLASLFSKHLNTK